LDDTEEKIVATFGAMLSETADTLRDIQVLPTDKQNLVRTLAKASVVSPTKERRDAASVAVSFVAHFQEGIGAKSIPLVLPIPEAEETVTNITNYLNMIKEETAKHIEDFRAWQTFYQFERDTFQAVRNAFDVERSAEEYVKNSKQTPYHIVIHVASLGLLLGVLIHWQGSIAGAFVMFLFFAPFVVVLIGVLAPSPIKSISERTTDSTAVKQKKREWLEETRETLSGYMSRIEGLPDSIPSEDRDRVRRALNDATSTVEARLKSL
jgi:ElaB/YqjD/DUF883 family membrane-anchored ribosome-binding protein